MFFTWKTMTMTLFRLNRQSRSSLKQLANQIRANTMTIFEELEVNKKIEKIAVVKSSMNCTYPCVSWWIRRNICPYCWKNCDKRKQQPWIVAVYRSLERQMYCKYWNNIQCEGLAIRCGFWWLQQKMYVRYVNNQQCETQAVNDFKKKYQ